jgi:hypothetical protein
MMRCPLNQVTDEKNSPKKADDMIMHSFMLKLLKTLASEKRYVNITPDMMHYI